MKAKKIYLTCNEAEVSAWAGYLNAHAGEVEQSLRQEGVRREMWFSGRDEGGLFVIGIMDADDAAHSARVAASSALSVDTVHRAFKTHWDRTRISDFELPSPFSGNLENCDCLMDASAQ